MLRIHLLILLLAASHYGVAQHTHLVQTTVDGKILPGLPELIYSNDKLEFKVSDAKESFTLYTKLLTDKANRARRQITRLKADTEKMALVERIYGIKIQDLDSIIKELDLVIKNPVTATAAYVPSFKAGDENYFEVRSGSQSTLFPPNTVSSPINAKPTSGDVRLNFSLGKTEPFKKLSYEWLKKTNVHYPGSFDAAPYAMLHEQITELEKKIRMFLAKIQPTLSKYPNYSAADIPALDSVAAGAGRLIDEATNFISLTLERADFSYTEYKEWILSWIWYQSADMPALNPFLFKAESDLGNEPDTSQLDILRMQVSAREEYYKAIDPKKTTMVQMDSIIEESMRVRRKKAAIEKAMKDFTAAKSKNDKAIEDFGFTSKLLNEGILLSGNPDKKMLHWQRHHDASQNYQLLNDDCADEYLEDDRVIILSHNLKKNESGKVAISFQDISNDASLLTEGLSPLIAKLQAAAGSLAPFGAPGTDSLNAVVRARDRAYAKVTELLNKVDTLKEYEMLTAYLMKQNNPVLEIAEGVDKSNLLHSEISNPAKRIKGPKKATYSLTTLTNGEASKEKIQVDTFTYRINKFYRMFPMAGFYYTPANFSEVKDGKISEIPHSRFVVGLKVYINKTDIRSPKFFTGKDQHGQPLWKSRLSGQVAFDVKKPLKNMYFGAGLDLWPGLCISGGAAVNQYTYAEFNDGQVIYSNDRHRCSYYVGISTDISLFTDVLKFLNLSK